MSLVVYLKAILKCFVHNKHSIKLGSIYSCILHILFEIFCMENEWLFRRWNQDFSGQSQEIQGLTLSDYCMSYASPFQIRMSTEVFLCWLTIICRVYIWKRVVQVVLLVSLVHRISDQEGTFWKTEPNDLNSKMFICTWIWLRWDFASQALAYSNRMRHWGDLRGN